jgi:hypothetical protein
MLYPAELRGLEMRVSTDVLVFAAARTVTDGHGMTPWCVAQPATHNARGLVRRQSASVKTADDRCGPKRPKLISFFTDITGVAAQYRGAYQWHAKSHL